MHLWRPPVLLTEAVTVAEAVGRVDILAGVDKVDTVDTMDMVDMEEAADTETVMKVGAPIAKMTAILQMHAESSNALRREETTMRAFVSSVRSQDMSMSIPSPTNVYSSGGK